MAMDRSGHRFAPLAVAYGAKIFDAKGMPVIDDGYADRRAQVHRLERTGLMPKEVWGGVGGSQYRDAFEEFANGRVVMYYSGSWQVKRMDTQVTKSFDWTVVPAPCGPAACTAMPGGAAFVALKRTKEPADWRRSSSTSSRRTTSTASTWRAPRTSRRTPAVAKGGVTYSVSPAAKAALTRSSPTCRRSRRPNYELQGYRFNRAVFLPTAQRLGQAVAGELSADDALKRLAADVDEQVKAATK